MNPNASSSDFLFAQKASINALQALLGDALDKAERLTTLNLNVARSFTEDSAAHARAMLAAGNVSDVINLHTERLQPHQERALAFTRGVTDIASDAQQEFVQVTHAWLGDLNSAFITALDHASKSAPASSEAIFQAVASVTNATGDLYEQMGQMAKEATEVASERMTAAASTALDTAASEVIQPKAAKSATSDASGEES